MLKRNILMLILGMVLILSACMNTETKEVEEYKDFIEEHMVEENKLIDYLDEYVTLIIEGKALEGIEVLENSYIPSLEEIIEEAKKLDYTFDSLMDIVNKTVKVYESELKARQLELKNYLHIKASLEDGNLDEDAFIQPIPDIIKYLKESNEWQVEATEDFRSLTVDSFGADENEIYEIDIQELFTEKEMETFAEAYEELITMFTLDLAKQLDIDMNAVNSTDDDDFEDVTPRLNDKGSPFVVIDAEAAFDEDLIVTGETNLLEGSTLGISTKIFGSTNPYIEGEAEVDADGNFETIIQMTEEEFTGDPLAITIRYSPDEDVHDIYGEEGELIEGPFAKKYMSIKRTRTAAITTGLIALTEGESVTFEPHLNSPPEDYGDLDIWIEPESVTIHDDYYDIELKSNLNALTSIDIDIEIPGYQLAGYRSLGVTRDDGSARFQVKRVEDIDLEDTEEVVFFVEAVADYSLESEELYGTYGENFEGDLTVKTKRGKKIEYRFKLDEFK